MQMLNLNECERRALTDVLQHEAGQVGGGAVGRIHGCDVDHVVGEELQVGQVEVPHLRKQFVLVVIKTGIILLLHNDNLTHKKA